MSWTVGFTNKANKQYRKLNENVQRIVDALVADLQMSGPFQSEWDHYGKLHQRGDKYHCHIKSGHPTYVACWEVIDKQIRIMEIYYVGAHENAPY